MRHTDATSGLPLVCTVKHALQVASLLRTSPSRGPDGGAAPVRRFNYCRCEVAHMNLAASLISVISGRNGHSAVLQGSAISGKIAVLMAPICWYAGAVR